MKTILVLSILFSAIVLPVRAELTETDLENIRRIFQEEWEKPIIDHIETSFDSINTSFDNINRDLNQMQRDLDRIQMMLWIATALVVVAGIVNWWHVLKLWRSR